MITRLPERHAALERRDRHQLGPFSLERADRAREQLGLVAGVGIGEEQDLAASGAVAGGRPTAFRTSRPAAAHLDQPDARSSAASRRDDGGVFVGRVVVHHQ
jgi:hypothetical protein